MFCLSRAVVVLNEVFCSVRLPLFWNFAQRQQTFVRAFLLVFVGVLRLLSSSAPSLGHRRQKPTQGPDHHVISRVKFPSHSAFLSLPFRIILGLFYYSVQYFQWYLMAGIHKSTFILSFWKRKPPNLHLMYKLINYAMLF